MAGVLIGKVVVEVGKALAKAVVAGVGLELARLASGHMRKRLGVKDEDQEKVEEQLKKAKKENEELKKELESLKAERRRAEEAVAATTTTTATTLPLPVPER